MIKKSVVIIAIITTIVTTSHLSWAYNGEVHYKINDAAVQSSQLDSVLRDQLGIENGIEAKFKKGKKTKPVWEWIADGGKTEDYGMLGEYDYLTTRAYNHFHDPLENWDDAGFNKPGLNELYYASYARYPVSAILWGLKPGEQEFLLNFTVDWSWGKARDSYHKALTDLTEDQRNQNFADCFRALGQVMHLLQESSVPLHTRNDAHIFPIIGRGPWTYETFTEEYKDRFDYTACRPDPVLLTDPQPDQNYSNIVPISGLFDRNQYKKGDSIPLHNDTIGIAEYSNANFLTEDTMWSYQHPSLADTNYDRIDWLNPEQIDAEDGLVDNRLYIRKEVGEQIAHLAVLDYWSREYQGHEEHIPRAYSLDKVCWNDYQKKLIPRAVGYSAALLDYFFRGKLEVEFVDEGLKITNKSEENMHDGYFELYYDNAEGERQAIEIYSGAEVTALQPDGEQTITFDPPGDAKSHMLLYRGALGNETDAVVGKVIVDGIGLVYVAVSHSDYTERCIVWDPEGNDYAELTNPTTGSLMSFPCDRENIQWWLDRTNSVSNGALYSFVRAGEDAIGVQEGSETSANTGCGVQTNTIHREGFVRQAEDQGGWTMCMWVESNVVTNLSAILSYLIGSWNLTILNDVGGTTCVRTILDYVHTFTESCGHPDYCEGWPLEHGCTRTQSWVRRSITPLGDLISITDTENLSIHWNECYRNVGNRIVSQWGTWGNAYSDRVMVQIYVDHVIIRDTIGARGTLWCAFYCGSCNPVLFQETSRSRVTGIKAACDFYDDANAVDPRMQNVNAAFTSAVDGLIADFYEVNGIAGDMLWPENTQLDVDIRR